MARIRFIVVSFAWCTALAYVCILHGESKTSGVCPLPHDDVSVIFLFQSTLEYDVQYSIVIPQSRLAIPTSKYNFAA